MIAAPEELRSLCNAAYFVVNSDEWRSQQREAAVDRILAAVPDGWAKIAGRWVHIDGSIAGNGA